LFSLFFLAPGLREFFSFFFVFLWVLPAGGKPGGGLGVGGGGGLNTHTPPPQIPEIPKALQIQGKLNPNVKTVKNC